MTTHHHGRSTRTGKRAKTDRPRKPQKLQPILLDRLAHALQAHGVALKRTDVLQVAAAAFGFHNPNEFSAAALTVPAVEALAKVTMADGETLTLVRDPVAGATYGLEDQFIAQAVAEERREFLGLSPYGHLLDLSGLPDVDPIHLGRAEIGANTPLHIAIIEHKHGTSASAALSEAELYDQIADFCSEYWHEAEGRAGPITDYTTSKEIVDAYFDGHDSESLYVETATLPRAKGERPTPSDLDPLYPYADYRSYLAVTGERQSYPDWVAARKSTPLVSRRVYWETREAAQMLSLGDCVINDIHHVCADGQHLRPGMIGRVENVVTSAGSLQIVLRFAGGASTIYTDLERGGRFPVMKAVCSYTTDMAPKDLDWVTAMALPGFGTLVEATVSVDQEDLPIAAGSRMRIGVNYPGVGGSRQLVLRFETGPHKGKTTILSAPQNEGVYPLRVVAEGLPLQPTDNLFLEDDWKEAVTAGASQRMSFSQWNEHARQEQIHLRDRWMTESEARALKPGDALTIRVHGRGDAFNDELGESYEGDYVPGTTVTVEEVADYGGKSCGLMIYVTTTDHIEIIVPVRAGYVPLARIQEPATEATAILPAHHNLYIHDDWVEAVNARACNGLSFEAWNAKAKDDGVHLRDGWLTEDQARGLKKGDPLKIQVHGQGRAWIQEWEVYDGRYEPGTLVTVDDVQDLGERGVWVYVSTADHIEIVLPARSGYLPVSRAAPAKTEAAMDQPDLGEVVAFDGVESTIEVCEIPEHQPLAADGIVVIVDQYRETHTCTRDGDAWVIVRPDELTDAQRDTLTAR